MHLWAMEMAQQRNLPMLYQEDGAMAVLMDNTPTNPTEPEGQEAAPDIQDPCKDLIELRIQKVLETG